MCVKRYPATLHWFIDLTRGTAAVPLYSSAHRQNPLSYNTIRILVVRLGESGRHAESFVGRILGFPFIGTVSCTITFRPTGI